MVSVEDLPAGTLILASDLELPEGSTLSVDPETLIVNVTNAPSAEAVEAELAEAEAEAGIEPTLAEPTAEESTEAAEQPEPEPANA